MTPEEIIEKLGIKEEIIAIWPYGSQVYGNATKHSDHDYILVAKSTLESGGDRNNAVSSEDYLIQGTLYSRAGFIDAINRYYMPAMECLSLEPEQVILKKFPFKMYKFDENEMIDKVVKQASDSWYISKNQQKKYDQKDRARKGLFHAIRILKFGLQLKESQKITDLGECNNLFKEMMKPDTEDLNFNKYMRKFDKIRKKLKPE